MNRKLSCRQRLPLGSAWVALSIAAIASPAHAEDECGALLAGSVTCDARDGPIDRISYVDNPGLPTNLSIELGDHFVLETAAIGPVVHAANLNGSVSIIGGTADIVTTGSDGTGVMAGTDKGDVSIELNSVVTGGERASGIITTAVDGATTIRANRVETVGSDSFGIIASSDAGGIDIGVGSINTAGFSSDAITVRSGGASNIRADSIAVAGDWSFGISSIAMGDVDIDVDRVTTAGFNGQGVIAVSLEGGIAAKVGEVSTLGEGANGAFIQSLAGKARLDIGKASTKGDSASGAVAFTTLNDVLLNAGEVSTDGIFSQGVYASSSYYDATANVQSVTTMGDFSDGLVAEAGGAATANIHHSKTLGSYAFAAFAQGGTATVNATGTIETYGAVSAGLVATSRTGDATVNLSGTVMTSGSDSAGIWVNANGGGTAVIRAAGPILTYGGNSFGIDAIAQQGSVDIAASAIETRGDGAHGIQAETSNEGGVVGFGANRPVPVSKPTGLPSGEMSIMSQPIGALDAPTSPRDVRIVAASVNVSGTGAIGIKVKSVGTTDLDVGTISALKGEAIRVESAGDASLRVRGAVRSATLEGVNLKGEDISVALDKGASIIGGEHGLILEAVGEALPPPVGGPEPVIFAAGPGTASVVNEGTIQGMAGRAIWVKSGSATITNKGSIVGSIATADGDDRLVNEGSHHFRDGSDFGNGNDLYVNRGTMELLASAAPKDVRFEGLERLENAGTIDLANGTAGDRLAISGDYLGGANAALRLDVDLAGGAADRLVVDGAAMGTTLVTLQHIGKAGLARDGIVIASGGAGSLGSAFALANPNAGFLGYHLEFDGGTRNYLLSSHIGEGAYRAGWVAEAALLGVNDLAAAWSSHAAAERQLGHGPERRFWGVASLASGEGDANYRSDGGESIELRLDDERNSYLVGIDLLRQASDSNVRAGLLGGYQDGAVDFARSEDKASFETVTGGAYASFSQGQWFANLMVNYSRHWLRFDSPEIALGGRSDGDSWGSRLELGARFSGQGWFIEPSLLAGFASQHVDPIKSDDQQLELARHSHWRTSFGVRGGVDLGSIGDVRIGASASASFARNFSGSRKLELVMDDEALTARAAPRRNEGVATVGLTARGKALNGFLEGEALDGSGYRSNAIRLGLSLGL